VTVNIDSIKVRKFYRDLSSRALGWLAGSLPLGEPALVVYRLPGDHIIQLGWPYKEWGGGGITDVIFVKYMLYNHFLSHIYLFEKTSFILHQIF